MEPGDGVGSADDLVLMLVDQLTNKKKMFLFQHALLGH